MLEHCSGTTCTLGTAGLPETDLSPSVWAHFDFRETTRFFKSAGIMLPEMLSFLIKPSAVIMLFQTLHRTLHVFPVFIKFD